MFADGRSPSHEYLRAIPSVRRVLVVFVYFFFNDTATTEIYTLSLHDALPICRHLRVGQRRAVARPLRQRRAALRQRRPERRLQLVVVGRGGADGDRKSTRLNSSH